MELRQLEYFCKIAETGSINEAARRMNMSQPPLSYQMRQLEDELNVRLFQRSSRGVELTEAGRLLYSRSASLLEYVRSTRQAVAEAGKKRVLRMGITSTTVGTIMPYISLFSQCYPDVSFEVRSSAAFLQLWHPPGRRSESHLPGGILFVQFYDVIEAVYSASHTGFCRGRMLPPSRPRICRAVYRPSRA